jgi:CBS domain-containing protein
MLGFIHGVLAEKGRQVYTVEKGVTVAAAVREMNEKGIGGLLVMDGRRPVGIFTERDVLRRVVDDDRDPAQTKVLEVMTRQLLTVTPETRVEEAMAMMTDRRCRHLPVLAGDEVIGLVSIGDLMRWITMHQEDEIRHMTAYITGQG